MSSSYRLDAWDYVTGTLFVFVSCAVGLYHVFKSGKQTSFQRFLVSSDDVGLIPIILSSISTIFSAVGLLGYTAEVYMNGIIFFMVIISCWISIVVGFYIHLPVFYRLPSNTIFEYLELRFSKRVKLCITVALFLQLFFFTGIVIYGPSLAVSQVSGLDLWTSITAVTVICTVYTALGGFKAVVWADVVQTLVMFLFMLIIIIQGLIEGGGFAPLWEKLKTGRRLELAFWSWSTDLPNSFWTYIVGFTTCHFAYLSVSQSLMQRCKSCPNLKKAQVAYSFGIFGISCVYFLTGCMGLLIYAQYSDCDPLLNGDVELRDQLLPLYATQILSPYKGLSGIFIAGILSATLSTLSSNLNTLVVITIYDFVTIFKKNLSDRASIKISRFLTILYGGICMALVSLCANMGGIIAATWAIVGLCSGPVFAIFTMGMLLPWVNSTGALVGFFCSMVLPAWSLVGKMVTSPVINSLPISTDGCSNYSAPVTNVTQVIEPEFILQEFYSLSAFWYPCWSIGVSIITALIASKVTGFSDLSQINPQLYCSFVVKYINRKQAKVVHIERANVEKNHGNQPLIGTRKL